MSFQMIGELFVDQFIKDIKWHKTEMGLYQFRSEMSAADLLSKRKMEVCKDKLSRSLMEIQ